MNKIVIIGVYFGKFPEYMDLWEKSCEYNKDIDFLIFTNQTREDKKNIKYIDFTLEDFSKLASEKLKLKVNIERAYKCCDFKVVYGVLFEEYIKEYSFWGHCDFDMIFGDIRNFITDELMEKYDKILHLGHLSLYRNNKVTNLRYQETGSRVGNYKDVFTSNESFAFDEVDGIYAIYKYNNYPVYDKRIFADISMIYKRFKLAMKDKNYNNQVFYWDKGKVFRAYEQNKKIEKEEFIYIHFKKRKEMHLNSINTDNVESFYITNKGFYNKENSIPTIKEINKYNRYICLPYELFEKSKYIVSYNCRRIKRKIKKLFRG